MLNVFVKALKEGLRVVVLAILPVILVGIDANTGKFALNLQVVYATALVAFLRFVDKFLHEGGIDKGLTQF